MPESCDSTGYGTRIFSPSFLPTGGRSPSFAPHELPGAVQVAPLATGELGARVLAVGVGRGDLVAPAGGQLVRGVVVAAGPEGVDGRAVALDEAAFAVVGQVGVAEGVAVLVADDRFRQAHEEGARVVGVGLHPVQRPFRATDDGGEVVLQAGRERSRLPGEVEFQGAAVRLDGGADGAVVLPVVGQPERRRRDGLLLPAGFGPAQAEAGAAEVLEVLDLDVHLLTGGQLDLVGDLFLVPVVDPVVDDQLVVDPEPEAVVTGHGERRRAGLLRDQLAGPADADVVRLSGRGLEPGVEAGEVDVRIEDGGLQLVEVEGPLGGVGVVLALEAVGDDRFVVARRRARGGDAEGREGQGRGQEQCQVTSVTSEAGGAHGSSLRELRKTLRGRWRLAVPAGATWLYNVGRNGSWHDSTRTAHCPDPVHEPP